MPRPAVWLLLTYYDESAPCWQWSMPYDPLALLRILEPQLFHGTAVGRHSVAGGGVGVHNLRDVAAAKHTMHRGMCVNK